MSNKESVAVIVPMSGFRRWMYFNRFAVERDAGFVQIHCGLVNRTNGLVDSYSTAISDWELLLLQKTSMDYLGAQGTLLEEPPAWQPPISSRMDVANHIVMARHGPIAETVFYSYSYWAALMAAKRFKAAQEHPSTKESAEEPSVVAEPIALLRSPLAVQQHLIKLLFAEAERYLPQ